MCSAGNWWIPGEGCARLGGWQRARTVPEGGALEHPVLLQCSASIPGTGRAAQVHQPALPWRWANRPRFRPLIFMYDFTKMALYNLRPPECPRGFRKRGGFSPQSEVGAGMQTLRAWWRHLCVQQSEHSVTTCHQYVAGVYLEARCNLQF